MLPLLLSAALTLSGPHTPAACVLSDHYRWPMKVDESFRSLTATRVTIGAMLTSWPIVPLYAGHALPGWCAPRTGNELKTYSVAGWVRAKRMEDDGDWHVELTATQTGAVTKCIVVEIPPGDEGAQYTVARNQFVSRTGIAENFNGDVAAPVKIRVMGVAFFDGQHRGAKGTSNPPHGHGRCNSSNRALWEIHPVYSVVAP